KCAGVLLCRLSPPLAANLQGTMSENAEQQSRSVLTALANAVAGRVLDLLDHIGGVFLLLLDVCRWILRSITRRKVRLGRVACVSRVVRVGVRSIFIISLVWGCVGLIRVLQMAPPLDEFGRKDLVANITGVAIMRELGPLIAAIVLTGFAGAAI